MREKIKDLDRLLHIKEAIDNVLEFMNSKSADDLAKDKLLSYPTMYLPNGSLLIVQDMTKLQMYVEMAVAGMVSQAGSNVLYRPNQCGSINMCIRYMP